MWEVENRYKVRLGGNNYINVENIITFQDVPLFTLKRHDDTGYLGIFFEIYNEKGDHIASVKRNEIYSGDKSAYKVEGTANRYTFTELATGRIICDIKMREEALPAEFEIAVELYTPSGSLFSATADKTNLGGMQLTGNTFEGGKTAIAL